MERTVEGNVGKDGLDRGEERLFGEMERNVQNSGGMAEGIALTEMRVRELENKQLPQ